jgi:hypothetical protein
MHICSFIVHIIINSTYIRFRRIFTFTATYIDKIAIGRYFQR